MNYQLLLSISTLLLFGCETADKIVQRDEQTVYHSEWPGIKIDPIEVDPDYSEIFSNIDVEVNTALKDHERHIGFIHVFWTTKKEMLFSQYGVVWRSPQEMNPHVNFD